MNKKTAIGLIIWLALGVWGRAELFQDVFERTIPVAPDVTVTVRNIDGTIYLYGAKEPRIRITARKRAFSKARLDGISVNVANEGKTVSIDTIYPKNPTGLSLADRSGTVDYLILLPETATLAHVELVNGEIIIDGMRGPAANARLTNGRMTARNCFSAVKLVLETGVLDAYYNWWEARPFSLVGKIENGNARVQLPKGAAFQLDAASSTGRVVNQLAETDAQRGPVPALKTEIGQGGEMELQLRAVRGNIDIQKGY